MENIKTIIYSKTKFEKKIADHYESEGKYDYCEDGKTEFLCEFEDVDLNQTGHFKFSIVYDPFFKAVYKKNDIRIYEITLLGDEPVKIFLKEDNHNPRKSSLYHELEEITNHQLKVDEENDRMRSDILDDQIHNRY